MSTPFETPTTDPDAQKEADALVQAGLAASQANDAERALELFARASAACPASGVPHFLSGSEYASLGQIDKAEAALANAVLLAPSFHIARYQLGLLQFSAGRAAVALVTWQPLFALDDSEALGHFVRGFAALAQDDFAGATAHFEAGLACKPDNPALVGDIEKVLQRVRKASHENSAAESQSPEHDEATAQFLLSNYGKFGGAMH